MPSAYTRTHASFWSFFRVKFLLRHLGGIFGQPMLVAQVAIAHAERRRDSRKIQALPRNQWENVVEISRNIHCW